MAKTLVEYIHQPADTRHMSKEFAKAVLGTFAGRKAKTEVEKFVKSAINNEKVGVLVAYPEGDRVLVGYAQWNEYMDNYSKEQMIRIAHDRAQRWKNKDVLKRNIPFKIEKALPGFLHRAKRYFKDKKFVNWVKI